MSEKTKSEQVAKVFIFLLKAFGYTILILFILGLALALFDAALFQLIYSLLAGWAYHAFRVLPPLLGKLDALIFPILCTILFVFMAHYFIVWCLRQKESKLTWNNKHSIICAAILLLTCGAAIAMSGIAHQMAWLSTSKIIQTNRSGFSRDIQTLKQLGYALFNYHNDHGHYPHSTYELIEKEYCDNTVILWIENRNIELKEPYLLLAPGASKADPENMLAASPHIYKFGKVYKIAVLRADMSVVDMRYEDYLERLELQRKETP